MCTNNNYTDIIIDPLLNEKQYFLDDHMAISELTCEALWTVAGKGVQSIHTCSREAWVWPAVIHIDFTPDPLQTSRANTQVFTSPRGEVNVGHTGSSILTVTWVNWHLGNIIWNHKYIYTYSHSKVWGWYNFFYVFEFFESLYSQRLYLCIVVMKKNTVQTVILWNYYYNRK